MSGLLRVAVLIYSGRLIGGDAREHLFKDRNARFLVAWIIVEILVYFAMSPFPAARRLGELLFAMLLLVGRLCISRREARSRGRFINVAVATTGVCATVMLAIALVDAWNVVETARSAAVFVRANAQGGSTWQMTTLAFAHYFDAEGIARVDREATRLRPGDLLVVDTSMTHHDLPLQAVGLQPIVTIREGINLGVSVSTTFYRAANPWAAARDTRPAVTIFRASVSTGIPADFHG